MEDKRNLQLNYIHKSTQVYVILYSFFEKVINSHFKPDDVIPIAQKFEMLKEKLNVDIEISHTFTHLRRLRNEIVHKENHSVKFSKILFDDFLYNYNRFVKNVIKSNRDREKYFLNLLDTTNIRIPVSDLKEHPGFQINFVKYKSKCPKQLSSFLSLILGFLQKSNYIESNNYINDIQKEVNYEVKVFNVYKFALTFLLLIKDSNYYDVNDRVLSMNISIPDNTDDALIAIKMINYYLDILFALVDQTPYEIKLLNKGSKVLSLTDDYADIKVSNLGREESVPPAYNWFAPRINYKIIEQKAEISSLIRDLFNLETLLPGQFEVIRHILNTKSNVMTIMPTGSGKSLNFYFAIFMQPCASIVVSPTEVLISDQIRNLNNKHKITNVGHFKSHSKGITKARFKKINYFTPDDLIIDKYQEVLKSDSVIDYIDYIVLDEAHTLSEWSHDFRVEYFMALDFFRRYFFSTQYLCFTATASMKVVENLLFKLDIKNDDIKVPTSIINANFEFQIVDSSDFNMDIVLDKKSQIKTLLFTPSDYYSNMIQSDILRKKKTKNISLFSSEVKSSYYDFVDNKTKLLITSGEIGIGVDIFDINRIIHYGLPVSISQYIQEIGRGSRNGNFSKSFVFFPNSKLSSLERSMFNRNLDSREVFSILSSLNPNSMLRDLHLKFMSGINYTDNRRNRIIDLYQLLKTNKSPVKLPYNKQDNIYIYILYKIGVVDNWVLRNESQEVIVNLRRSFEDYNELVKVTANSMEEVNCSMNIIYNVRRAKNFVQLVNCYDKWYVDEYIRYHREQLINMWDLLREIEEKKSNDDQIISKLSKYMSLPKFNKELTSLEFSELYEMYRDKEIDVTDITRTLEDNYNAKLDMLIFIAYSADNNMQLDRLERVKNNIESIEFLNIIKEHLSALYPNLDFESKHAFYDYLNENFPNSSIFELIYTKIKKDQFYDYKMFEIFNKFFIKEIMK